LREKE
jgi:lysyl-tRNA synthetase, class II